MDKIIIEGGRRLEGAVTISGAKNAALPIMAAALLSPEPVNLTNLPALRDIQTMAALLRHMGADVEIGEDRAKIQARAVNNPEAPYDLVKTMRASALVLGPLLASQGRSGYPCPAAAPSAPGPSTCI